MSVDNKKSIISNPFIFIGIIALIASLILSFVSESTKERVKSNKKLDIMKNVLLCRYLEDYEKYQEKLSNPENIEKEYNKAIEQVLYYEDGTLVSEELDFAKLEWKENKSDGSMYFFFKSAPDVKYLPLFRVKDDNGYIVPVSGKGLWSTLKGFLYVSKDLKQIKGISFYSHTETPGLGGEIDKSEVKRRYVDKSIDFSEPFKDCGLDRDCNMIDVDGTQDNGIYDWSDLNDNGELDDKEGEEFTDDNGNGIWDEISEEIRVPKMVKTPQEGNNFELQYMSGATITSDGLNYFIKRDLDKYKYILLCESDSIKCKGAKK